MKKLAISGVALLIVLSAAWIALAAEGVHWSYEGEEGPDHWAELSPDFATCGSGTQQSPIDSRPRRR